MTTVPSDTSQPKTRSSKPYALALDIGTSSVRATLFDELGAEIAGASSRLTRNLSTTRDGGAELVADDGVEQLAAAIDTLLAGSSIADHEIEIVAIASFWHSLVGVGRDGAAMTPVYGWADTRAASDADDLRKSLDEHYFHARTGCRFHASYWPAKLKWIGRANLAAYSKVATWMSFSEFLLYRLFGSTAITVSMASGTGIFDQEQCTWDREMLDALDLDAARLPSIVDATQTFTNLSEPYARRWSQLRNARWFPAIGDGAANNVGSGCVTRDRAALMIGTSGALRVLERAPPPKSLPTELWCYRLDRERTVVGGALSEGGGTFKRMLETLNVKGSIAEIEAKLASMDPDSHGLTILPFWSGERSSGWHSDARGAILGLTSHTGPIEILRATMEAVAFRFAIVAKAVASIAPGASIVASGGALVSSKLWARILCDVLGVPIELSSVKEASSRGAVLLALESTGKIKSIEYVKTETGSVIAPDMKNHERYQEGLARQLKAYQRLITVHEEESPPAQ